MHEKRISIIIFLVVTFLYWVTLYLCVPTLPLYIKTKAINLSMVGLVLSMYGLWMAIARLPMGMAVDAIGRGKPLIMMGIGIASIGAFIMGRGNSLGILAAGRALTGIAAATWVPLLVVFSTYFSSEEAIFSSAMLTLSANIGRVVGTSLTGFLNQAGGYSLPFYLSAIIGIIVIGIASFVREERRFSEGISFRLIATLFMRKEVLIPALISIMVHYADWSVTFSFLPIIAQDMGASDVVKSIIISLNLISIAVANLANTLLLRKMKHSSLLCCGLFLLFAGIMVISFSHTISWLFLGTILMGFAFGIVYPILLGMSIHKVDRSQRNTAMGIHQSLYAIGMWTGPWLTGIIADMIGIQKTFVITGGFYLVTVYILIYLLLRKRTV
jgi:DHA1 family multidrug resistance protein-like MFS transporter